MLPTDAKGRLRLLPGWVPFRFFAAAVAFHLAGWLLLVAWPERVSHFSGGTGPVLAALHAFTVGILTMVVIGASLQVLPVATAQSARGARAAALVWWSLVPGAVLLVTGFAMQKSRLAAVGGLAVAFGLAVHAGLLTVSLARVRRQRALTAHAWVALASLSVVIVSGPLLAFRLVYALPWLPVRLASMHLVAAGFGFVGMLAVGFSSLLLSMFMVARGPTEARQRGVFGVLVASLSTSLVAAVADLSSPWTITAALPGLAASIVHAHAMLGILRRRRARDSGASVTLTGVAWMAFPVSIAAGVWALVGGSPQPFVALLVVSWLLSLVLGMLLRILPFLTTVHLRFRHGALPSVRDLSCRGCARLVVGGQSGAALLLPVGLASGDASIVRIAALSGLTGAFGLAAFSVMVVLRARAFSRAAGSRAPDLAEPGGEEVLRS